MLLLHHNPMRTHHRLGGADAEADRTADGRAKRWWLERGLHAVWVGGGWRQGCQVTRCAC